MSETLKKELREALDNPRLRYRLVEAWLNRKARESSFFPAVKAVDPRRPAEEDAARDKPAEPREAN